MRQDEVCVVAELVQSSFGNIAPEDVARYFLKEKKSPSRLAPRYEAPPSEGSLAGGRHTILATMIFLLSF